MSMNFRLLTPVRTQLLLPKNHVLSSIMKVVQSGLPS